MLDWFFHLLGASFVYGLVVALWTARGAHVERAFLTALLPPFLPLIVQTVTVFRTPEFPSGPFNDATIMWMWSMIFPAASFVGWLIATILSRLLRGARGS